jgi:hypothetical protein
LERKATHCNFLVHCFWFLKNLGGFTFFLGFILELFSKIRL